MSSALKIDTGPSTPSPRMAAPKLVTALFDNRHTAEKARQDLVDAGVPAPDVTITGSEDLMLESAAAGAEEQGFWSALKHLFMPDEDRHAYAEGLRRGGFTLAVHTDAVADSAVIDILDRDGAVDLDEREADWRNDGWIPLSGADQAPVPELSYRAPDNATAGFAAAGTDPWPTDEPATAVPIGGERIDRSAAEVAAAPAAAAAPPVVSPGAVGDLLAAAPAAAEQRPWRDTSHGRVRVRSYGGSIENMPRGLDPQI